MKKIFAVLLAVMMVASMATVASAAENTTTLTTTVPAATYTLNIPADQEIAYGSGTTDIGTVTVTESNGFAVDKNLKVTIAWEPFKSDSVATTIPFSVKANNTNKSSDTLRNGASIIFEGGYGNGVSEDARSIDGINLIESFSVVVAYEDWGKALAGEYTATITFTAEVVVEQ